MLAGLRAIAPWAVSALKGRSSALSWWSRGGDPCLPQANWRMMVRSAPGSSFASRSLSSTTTAVGVSVAGGGTNEASSSFHATSVPLGRIFNKERDYMFTAERNIRSFEWTTEEAEELLDPIDEFREGTEGVQLNTICLVRRELSNDDKARLGNLSRLFDVWDGQQRLASLGLLLAAIRERLLKEDAADVASVADEAASVIYPQRGRKGEPRVKLGDQDGNHVLEAILRKRDDQGLHMDLKKLRKEAPMPAPAQCLLEVYDCFVTRLKDRRASDVERLFYTLQENVYLNVGIADSQRVAFNMIVSQDKGKNIGYVDRFKALLCHHLTNDEAMSRDLQERWNRLCKEVERDTVRDCCLLLAQIVTRKRLQKGGEINLFSDLIQQTIPKQNRCGKDFFDSLELAARSLRSFLVDARVEEIVAASTTTKKCSVEFLRLASTKIRASKEIELVVFALLLRSDVGSDNWHAMMRGAERVALWMMFTKPVARTRSQRCMHILDEVADHRTGWLTHGASKPVHEVQSNSFALETTIEERGEIVAALDTYPFGSTRPNVLVAKAVLDRLNEYDLRQGEHRPAHRI